MIYDGVLKVCNNTTTVIITIKVWLPW